MIRVKDYDTNKPINGYKVTVKGTGEYSNFNTVKNHNSGESVSIDLLRDVAYNVFVDAKDYHTCNYLAIPEVWGNAKVLDIAVYKKSNYPETKNCLAGIAKGDLDSECYNDGKCDYSKWIRN